MRLWAPTKRTHDHLLAWGLRLREADVHLHMGQAPRLTFAKPCDTILCMLKTIQAATPVEIDTELAELYQKIERARSIYDNIVQRNTEARIAKARGESKYNPYTEQDEAEAFTELHALIEQALPLEDEYERRPWPRYWHVVNNNGHIHRFMSCTSCYPDTRYFWRTDLSGLTDVEVVEREAYNVCSVCMPIAPAEQKAAREYYNKQQREARKAEKEAKANEKLRKQAERAAKFLAKVEKIVDENYNGWDELYADYSLHGHDGKKSLYNSTIDLPAQVGNYLYDEMQAHEHREAGRDERMLPSRHAKDPKAIIAEATEKGLI